MYTVCVRAAISIFFDLYNNHFADSTVKLINFVGCLKYATQFEICCFYQPKEDTNNRSNDNN